MINLIDNQLWEDAMPHGNSPSSGTVVNYQPSCVGWFRDRLLFMVEKKYNVGWYKDEQWVDQPRIRAYQAGWIVSKYKYGMGTYEMEGRLPNFLNSFPAWWLYDIGNPEVFEFDMMEQFRKDSKDSRYHLSTTYHWGSNYTTDHHQIQGTIRKCLPLDRTAHLFRLVWNEQGMTTFMDGKKILSITDLSILPTKPMNMIVNSGLGDWNPTTDSTFEPFIVTKLTFDPL
jgi:beta-glucanase (GH16 family)